MKSLIIDDEPKSRRLLQHLCEEHCPELEIVGEAGSVKEGIEQIDKLKPDLVFLDIHMPVKSGFALLDHYQDKMDFSVIFTTAYEAYAIDAFKYIVVDYLEKPIEIEALKLAAQKALDFQPMRQPPSMVMQSGLRDKIQKIAFLTSDGYTFVKINDIIRCEADGNYTYVHLNNGESLLITQTLKHYEQLLESKGFFRVHKSHLINLQHVRKFIRGKKGMVEFINGAQVEVSVQKRDSLLDKLSNIN